jgi:hypothetical protein
MKSRDGASDFVRRSGAISCRGAIHVPRSYSATHAEKSYSPAEHGMANSDVLALGKSAGGVEALLFLA